MNSNCLFENLRGRLLHLQNLCDDEGLDALLFIPGIDGRWHWGSSVAMRYLMLGMCGLDLALSAQTPGGLPDEIEALEDVVILVQPPHRGGSIIYRESLLDAPGHCLPDLVHAWPGVKEFCIPKTSEDDSDLMERQKIRSFAQAMLGCVGPQGGRIGMALPPGTDPTEVERWPLIQSFALGDGVSAGVFFTLNYQVVDITAFLEPVAFGADAITVSNITEKGLDTFASHWRQTTRMLDRVGSALGRLQLQESEVCEPLSLLHEFGTIHSQQGANEPQSGWCEANAYEGMYPRVLFGKRAALVETGSISANEKIESTGVGGFPAQHLVVEGCEPLTGLRACRTYFLAHSTALLTAYQLLLGAYQSALQEAAKAMAEMDTYGVAMFLKLLQKTVGRLKENSSKSGISWGDSDGVFVDLMDSRGGKLESFSPNFPCLVYVRLMVSVQEGQDSTLGIAIGDTVVMGGGTEQFTVLTGQACCPYLQIWGESAQGSGVESEASHWMLQKIRDSRESGEEQAALQMGQAVDGGSHSGCALLLGRRARVLPSLKGEVTLYSGGWVFLPDSGLSPIIVSLANHVRWGAVVEAEVMGDLLLVMKMKKGPVIQAHSDVQEEDDGTEETKERDVMMTPLEASCPFLIPDCPDIIGLVLPQNSALARGTLQVLPQWRVIADQQSVPFLDLANAEESEDKQVQDAQAEVKLLLESYDSMNTCVPKSRVEQLAKITLSQVLSRYERQTPPGTVSQVSVTILLGLQGSGVLELAKNVWQFAQDEQEEQWVHVCVLGEGPNGQVDLVFLGEKVAKAASSATTSSSSTVHVLLTVCAAVGAASICSVLQRKGLQICTVASCIQTSSIQDPFVPGIDQKLLSTNKDEDVYAWPGLLQDQCRKGWVTHLVITSPPGPTQEQLAQETKFRSKVLRLNPLATCLGGSGGGVFMAMEPEAFLDLISSSAFGTPEMEKARQADMGHKWANLDPASCALQLTAPPTEDAPNFLTLSLSNILRLPDSQRLTQGLKELFPHAKTSVTGHAQDLGVVSWSSQNPKKLSGIRRALDLAKRKIEAEQLRSEGMKRMKEILKNLSKNKNKSTTGQITSVIAVYRCKPFRIMFGQPQMTGMLVEASESCIRILGLQDSQFLDAVGVDMDSALVLISGKGLSRLASLYVEKILKASQPFLPESRQQRTRESITDIELRRIENLHSEKPLPEGWFFDGSVFVDINGNRLLRRPDLEGFVEEFINNENKRISDMVV